MKITYDPRHNIAYLGLEEKTAGVEAIRVSDALNVDMAPDGRIYGVELFDAPRQPKGLMDERLVVENEETGATVEVGLP